MRIPRESLIFGGITLVTIVAVFGLFLLTGQTGSKAPEVSQLAKADSHVLGASDAKVVLVEFGDFQCPACRVSETVVRQVIREYKDRIKFVFRHYPLPFHNNAEIASEACEAAGEQGKFWEYHDLLYDHQPDWVGQSNPMKLFEDYARELNLNVGQFKKALEDHKFSDKVRADKKDGETFGVTGTPTFFLNQEKFTGGLSFDQFKQKIEGELAK